MKNHIKVKSQIIIFSVLTISMTILLAYFYTSMLSTSYNNEVEQTVKELSISQSNYLHSLVKSDMNTLKSSASFIEQQLIGKDVLNSEVLNTALKKADDLKSFNGIAIVGLDGIPITYEENIIDYSEYTFFLKALKGETAVETGTTNFYKGQSTTNFATPIVFNREVAYILVASINSTKYSDLLNTSLFDGEGYNIVFNSVGEVIIDSSNKNRIAQVKNLFEFKFSDESATEKILNEEEGVTRYSAFGNERFAAFTPIGINDWILFTVIPQDVISEKTSFVVNYTLIMWLGILAFSVGGLYFISATARRNEQQNSELKILNNKFTSLVDVKGVILFEIDLSVGNIIYNNNYDPDLARIDLISDLKDEEMASLVFHEDDILTPIQAINHVIETGSSCNYEVRIRHDNGEYYSFKVTLIPIIESNKDLTYIMGYMDDITEHRSEMETLKLKTQLDALTKIYNKEATKNLVEAYIKSSESKNTLNAMIAIDVDNFKGVNDDFGHLFGDKVIVELATSLKSIFRESDIVGRFGGDEFTVFIKNIPSADFVMERAKEIVKSFSRTYINDKKIQSISASVGFVLHSNDEDNFDEIYKKADVALYHAKNAGKSLIHMFESDFENFEK